MITPTFAQLDALATAPAVDEREHARYLVHQGFRDAYDGDPGVCRCQEDDDALFCAAPAHFRPWWAP